MRELQNKTKRIAVELLKSIDLSSKSIMRPRCSCGDTLYKLSANGDTLTRREAIRTFA